MSVQSTSLPVRSLTRLLRPRSHAQASPQTARAALAPLVDRDTIPRPARERDEVLAQGKSVALGEADKVVSLREEYADLALTAIHGKY